MSIFSLVFTAGHNCHGVHVAVGIIETEGPIPMLVLYHARQVETMIERELIIVDRGF